MHVKVESAGTYGAEAYPVEVEVNVALCAPRAVARSGRRSCGG